ncbi:MAG: heat-inducible transcription repressor HrcA [Chloroflexaceae bacterium]|nr:heat-inducible transcription repressor HrcA [Chloroflexaceae bacterium]
MRSPNVCRFILKLVVTEFIDTAAAISSDMVVRKYRLPISSATVRNEMAALELAGLLTHQHTSAGRIPTDAGYRLFVEELMDLVPLLPAEQQVIRDQFFAVRDDPERWIQLAATVLVRTTRNASVVTPPQAYQLYFRHLELIAINEATVLLVLVFHDGTVRQQTLSLTSDHTQEALHQLAGRINQCCVDAPVDRIEELLNQDQGQQSPMFDHFGQQVLVLIVRVMSQLQDQTNNEIHSDGLIEMLSQPEFIPSLLKEEDTNRAIERMRQALELLTTGHVLHALIQRVLATDGVQVVIGTEHGSDAMRNYSVVLTRYGTDNTATGVIGIIGPTRMAYPRSIPTVQYVSELMSHHLNKLYGLAA